MLDPNKPIISTSAPAPAAQSSAIQTLSAPNTAATATGAAPSTTASGGGLAAWKAALPSQVNDSVADKVKALTSQDSPLMQQAKTQGLKVANRRGLLNSSMAAGATQEAMLDKALPIASQDASQAFQKNMQANDYQFRMEGQDDEQAFQGGENALDRGLQKELTLKQIASTEGLAAAQRELETMMQDKSIAMADRQQLRDISSREGMAAAERALQDLMQRRDIASREGLAAAERDLQLNMQGNEIEARSWQTAAELNNRAVLSFAERENQQVMQQREIDYQTSVRQLDRGLQEKLASWNLKSSDRNAAAQLLTNMSTLYNDRYASVMANQNLDAATRTAQLASAKALRDRELNFVEQLFVVDLNW